MEKQPVGHTSDYDFCFIKKQLTVALISVTLVKPLSVYRRRTHSEQSLNWNTAIRMMKC